MERGIQIGIYGNPKLYWQVVGEDPVQPDRYSRIVLYKNPRSEWVGI